MTTVPLRATDNDNKKYCFRAMPAVEVQISLKRLDSRIGGCVAISTALGVGVGIGIEMAFDHLVVPSNRVRPQASCCQARRRAPGAAASAG